jgi:hypothetical protein
MRNGSPIASKWCAVRDQSCRELIGQKRIARVLSMILTGRFTRRDLWLRRRPFGRGRRNCNPCSPHRGPGRTQGPGVSLLRGGRQGEAGKGIGYHLHIGVREGARHDQRVTDRSARQ